VNPVRRQRYSCGRRTLLVLGLLTAAGSTACTLRYRAPPGSYVPEYERRLCALLHYADPEIPAYDYSQFWHMGADSVRSLLDSFLIERDPLPGNGVNEYRNLIEARLTAVWDSLLSGWTITPDYRVIPRVFHGSPTRTSEIPLGQQDAQVLWFYEPPFPLTDEISGHPLLDELAYCFIFTRNRWGHHVFDDESPNPFPPLPHLTPADCAELATRVADENASTELRLACIWRLRADPGHHALQALLGAGGAAEPRIRQSLAAAICPLTVTEADENGEFDLVAAEVDSSRMRAEYGYGQRFRERVRALALDRKMYAGAADSLYLTHQIAIPYDPAATLPAEIVEELQQSAEGDAELLAGRGWLTAEAADSIYTGPLADARALIEADEPLAAHEFLQPLLRSEYRANSEAWNLDARALMQSGEPGGREMAETSIRTALRLDPDNLRYLLTLAEVQFQRTFDRYGNRALDRILAETASVADAHALKGKLRLEIIWHLGWRAGGWGTPLAGMTGSRSEQETEALAYLNSALLLDPDNAFATWWLGLHHMLTGRWVEVIRIMDYLVAHGAHPAEAYLGRGLAYQNIGWLEAAMADYEQGIARLTDRVRVIARDPRWTLPLSEGGFELTGGVSIQTERAVDPETFWRSRDPLFGTDLNERLMEQYRRFAHVTWYYAVPQLGLAGWDTDRGRIYMRFGEPLSTEEVERRRLFRRYEEQDVPDEFSIHGQASSFGLVQMEYWYYDGFRIPLMIGMLTGNRILPYKQSFRELIEVVPESPRVTGAREVIDTAELDLGLRWYRFENRAGQTELYLHAQFPKPRLIGALGDTMTGYSAQMTILDDSWNPLTRRELVLPAWLFMADRSLPLITEPFRLEPEWITGEHLFGAMEVLPPGAGPAYAGRDTIDLAVEGPLRLSSLVAAEEIRAREESGDMLPGTYLTRGERTIIPALSDRFHYDAPLYLYLEIYGLELDDYRAHHYRLAIETTAVGGETPSPVIEALGRLIGTERQEGSVRLIFERDGIGTRATEENRILFEAYEPAEAYLIAIEVTDLTADRTIRRAIRLEPYVTNARLERPPPGS